MLNGVGELVFYVLALVVSMAVLWFVKWDTLFVNKNRTVAIILYVLCSLALAYLVGSFLIKIVTI